MTDKNEIYHTPEPAEDEEVFKKCDYFKIDKDEYDCLKKLKYLVKEKDYYLARKKYNGWKWTVIYYKNYRVTEEYLLEQSIIWEKAKLEAKLAAKVKAKTSPKKTKIHKI